MLKIVPTRRAAHASELFPKSFQVAFERRSLPEKLWRDFDMTRDSRASFSYRRTSLAFLNFFQASGADSAVFARTSVPKGIRSDLQLLTKELFQRVFHILVWLHMRKGEKELSFASSCLEYP